MSDDSSLVWLGAAIFGTGIVLVGGVAIAALANLDKLEGYTPPAAPPSPYRQWDDRFEIVKSESPHLEPGEVFANPAEYVLNMRLAAKSFAEDQAAGRDTTAYQKVWVRRLRDGATLKVYIYPDDQHRKDWFRDVTSGQAFDPMAGAEQPAHVDQEAVTLPWRHV